MGKIHIFHRLTAFWLAIGATVLFGAMTVWASWWWGVAFAAAAVLVVLGIGDRMQVQHSLRRNYPIMARLRYLLEEIRPEIRQYFLESDTDGVPFNRENRSVVYQRAKGQLDKRPFGTKAMVYEDGYEWINHSIVPNHVEPAILRVQVGGQACSKPYAASVYNISAMSFGSLSANAVRSLNKGARKGGFYHDTGEGGLSQYHLEHGGDIVWELGSGYFGCRREDGGFDPDKFARTAQLDAVKMIELKLSQGAKPGHGGVLPGPKVSAEIAAARGVPIGIDCISPARHPAFTTPLEMLAFIARLRELSGGKPTGIKLCIGHPWEFLAIAKAMHETGTMPDFIVVDGAEGGTGAAPLEFTDHIGTPMREGLLFVRNALVGLRMRDQVRVACAGKIVTGFDMARAMAIGADWCNAARGFMFAIGCVQSQSCHTDRCPTGVATQDPVRQRAIDVPDKAERVYRFHKGTVTALAEVVGAAGLTHSEELRPHHVSKRVSPTLVRTLDDIYRFLEPGELQVGTDHPVFRRYWPLVRPDRFDLAA